MLDITENTLFNALAQLDQISVVNKRSYEQERDTAKNIQKTNQIFKLEKKKIEILILYGNEEVSFDEIKMVKDENGDITYSPTVVKSFVHEKIFLDLHSDEVELQMKN